MRTVAGPQVPRGLALHAVAVRISRIYTLTLQLRTYSCVCYAQAPLVPPRAVQRMGSRIEHGEVY